ncbi:hypothetical protein LWI28_013815 [Acer negundo]|uniref:Uncharacterized protein n=1 Tax=Acer negundo TaxID=4023 RepID=A0AAD5IMK8_ACENE|nr:hypothetical protein LWI28_013815 [Acer negundo]
MSGNGFGLLLVFVVFDGWAKLGFYRRWNISKRLRFEFRTWSELLCARGPNSGLKAMSPVSEVGPPFAYFVTNVLHHRKPRLNLVKLRFYYGDKGSDPALMISVLYYAISHRGRKPRIQCLQCVALDTNYELTKLVISAPNLEFFDFNGTYLLAFEFNQCLLLNRLNIHTSPILSELNISNFIRMADGLSQAKSLAISWNCLQGILTYTHRLVSVEFQGSLGSMSSCGTLYSGGSSAPSDVMWTGDVSTHASEPYKKNLFLQSLYEDEKENGTNIGKNDYRREIQDKDIVKYLDNDVHYWTDFSKVHYHPQSLYELSGLWMDAQEFNNHGIGKDAFTKGFQGEEICERLRFFVEECDHIQGFQFIVDDSGGFSAVAAKFLENIADEYTNTPVLLYAVGGPGSHVSLRSRKQTIIKELHDAVSFSRLAPFSKLIVPVGLPFLSTSKASAFLRIKDEKPYHCSAVYAAALHSTSTPFRMEPVEPSADSGDVSGAMDVNGLIQMLAGQARQNMVAILDVSMPAPALTGKRGEQSLIGSLQSLTPDV